MKTTKNKMILSLATVLALGILAGCGSDTSENEATSIAQNTASASDLDNSILPTGITPEVEAKPKEGWYVSTRVSVSTSDKTYEGTNPAVFGEVTDAVDGSDKYDVPTFASVVTRKAAVVFVQNDWAERSGEYHSDYRAPKEEEKNWEMTVFSSVPGAEVTLKWDGLYVLTEKEGGFNNKKTLNDSRLENLQLIDTETGIQINAIDGGKLNTYTFTMGTEGSRTFIWTEGSATVEVSESTKTYIETKQKEALVEAQNNVKLKTSEQSNKFPLPPM